MHNWSLSELRGSGVHATLLIVTGLALVVLLATVFLPLWLNNRAGLHAPNAVSFAAYFIALGVGFMVVEIALMQKATLLLGNPMYSLAILLGTVLLSAGAGSYAATRYVIPMRRLTAWGWAALSVLAACASVGLLELAPVVVPLPLATRALIAGTLVAPVGLILGVFFPTGLALVKRHAPAFAPWAWGMNGSASVVGSLLAIMLAMWHGFAVSLAVGVCCYGVAAFAAFGFPTTNDVG